MRGFTLMEALCIVALLAMASVALVGGLAGAGESASARAALDAILDLDARARLLARSGAPCLLTIDDDRASVSAIQDGERLLVRPLRCAVRLTEPGGEGRPVAFIAFDRTGASGDYRVVVQRDSGGPLSAAVAGLTGWFGVAEAP